LGGARLLRVRRVLPGRRLAAGADGDRRDLRGRDGGGLDSERRGAVHRTAQTLRFFGTPSERSDGVLDLLIRNGRVIDGTGNPWYRADVGIRGDRIAAVGRLDRESATRTIDADGLAVCPGFVDMHTHSDLALLAEPTWECKIMQGVTLEVLGQDG